jgi:hypothetical protein
MKIGVRVCQTQHDGVRQAVEDEVVEIAALAGQEPLILASLRRVACAGSYHRMIRCACRSSLTIADAGRAVSLSRRGEGSMNAASESGEAGEAERLTQKGHLDAEI